MEASNQREGVLVPTSTRPGAELAGRYRLEDLLDERDGGRFFRAWDRVLTRHVAVHVIATQDPRADALREAARFSVGVHDRRVLRVLDIDDRDGVCFVVNEWGSGRSLDIILSDEGPMGPRRAAWVVAEVAATIAGAHEREVAHGRLVPENILIDHNGQVRVIGLAVDAALHGLPAGRTSADVTDLAGNLYAALTGQWAGISHSKLPAAHIEGSRVLRPRKVRAGIPRELDHLCDTLLNGPQHRGSDPDTALAVHEALRDFVGDYARVARREAARAAEAAAAATQQAPDQEPDTGPVTEPTPAPLAEPDTGSVTEPTPAPLAEPDTGPDTEPRVAADPDTGPDTGHDTQPRVAAEPDTEPTVVSSRVSDLLGEAPTAKHRAAEVEATELPTQAGMPVFHDDAEDVGWFSQSSEPVAPPPPPPKLEEPAPKPLFAPEPEHGRPVRTPRPGSAAAEDSDPSPPWGGANAGHHTGTGTGTGTGAVPAFADDQVPGRNWLRLAMGLGLAVLLVLLVAVVFNLGNSRQFLLGDSSGSDDDSNVSEPIEGLSARDIDPQGSAPRRENPDTVGNTVDGDPETSWTTLTYNENFGPGGLKTGLGVVVDLGEVRAPRTVDVLTPGEGETSFTLYLSNRRPAFIRDLSAIARESGSGTIEVELDGGDRGRYLVVWLTSLPPTDDGRYRGAISEIQVGT